MGADDLRRLRAQIVELRSRVVNHLVEAATQSTGTGFAAPSMWTACCLEAWRRARASMHAHQQPARSDPSDAMAAARAFYEDCIAVTLYVYQSETDSFEPVADPPQRASALPILNATPGSGLLWHVARSGRTYRTRNIHLEVRSRRASDDLRRGLWEAVYVCIGAPPIRHVVVLSAPAAGLLDEVAEKFAAWASEIRVAEPPPPSERRWELKLPSDALPALLEALVSTKARSDGLGIMIAAIRQATPADQGGWRWLLAGRDSGVPPPSYAPRRIARAISKRVMLGSLARGWLSGIDDQVASWRRVPADQMECGLLESGVPGVRGYEVNLHRIPIWVTMTTNREATAILRASHRGPIPDPRPEALRRADDLGRALAAVLEESASRLHSSVMRVRRHWDFAEELLQLAADHLAGRPATTQEFAALGRSADLLCELLTGMQTRRAPSIAARLRDAAPQIERSWGCLRDMVMIVPWMYRPGYRVAAASARSAHGRRAPRHLATRPRPPDVCVVHPATAGCLLRADQVDRLEPDAAGAAEAVDLARVATSRSYLVPLQKLISAIRVSRAQVHRIVWTDDTTIELWDERRCQETLALDLPVSRLRRFATLDLYQDTDKDGRGLLYTIHHSEGNNRALRNAYSNLPTACSSAEPWYPCPPRSRRSWWPGSR